MIPVLFRIGPIPINSYGLMLVIGFISGYFLLTAEFKRRSIPVDFASTEVTLGMIGAIIGSRIFHVFEHLDDYSWDNFGALFKGSGFSWYGGFVLVAILVLGTARAKKISLASLVDASSPATAIGYAFGRIGCFLSGDGCYGHSCASLGISLPAPFCMAFPKGAVPTSEVVFNTPVVESLLAFLTFGYLMVARNYIKRPAGLFAQFLIIHAVLRFAIEFVRNNPDMGAGLTQAQWVSIFAAAGGVILWFAGPKIPVPVPAAAAKQPQKRSKKGR